jgi:hypothetical protein
MRPRLLALSSAFPRVVKVASQGGCESASGRGVPVEQDNGFGQAVPIGSIDTPDGREKIVG